MNKAQKAKRELLNDELKFFGYKLARFISVYAAKPRVLVGVKAKVKIKGVGNEELERIFDRYGSIDNHLAALQSQNMANLWSLQSQSMTNLGALQAQSMDNLAQAQQVQQRDNMARLHCMGGIGFLPTGSLSQGAPGLIGASGGIMSQLIGTGTNPYPLL